MKNDRERIKCVLVGDMVTWYDREELLKSYINNNDPSLEQYFYVHKELKKDLIIDDKLICMILLNPSCQDDHRLRTLSYSTDVFMLIFSITSLDSFESILTKFYPEINSFAPKIPFILVGIHLEYRNDISKQQELESRGLSMVTKEMGQKLAQNIRAQQYCECSGLTQEGLFQTFEAAARIGLSSKEKKKPKPVSLFKWPDFFGKHRKDKDQGPYGKNQPSNVASKPR